MKSLLFFIQLLLTVSFIYPQEYLLNFKNDSKLDYNIKKFDSYKDLILSIEDSLISLKKQGNIDAQVKSLIQIDPFTYEVIIEKNDQIKYVKINRKTDLSDDIIEILNIHSLENGLINFNEIDIITKKISEKLSKNGYPFAKVGFKNHKFLENFTVESEIIISYGSRRYLNDIIVKGYEYFPKNILKNIFGLKNNKPLDIDKAIIQSNQIDDTKFAKNSREPEILFKKDSTFLYLYLEKIKRNSFDGFITFDSDENSGKIDLQGYAKINLLNTFNKGEKINFNFKSQKNQDRELNSNIYFPFFLGSPLNFEYGLNLIQKDSMFSSTEQQINIDMNFGKIRSGLGFQNNKSDSYGEIEFVENFQSKLFNIFSDYTILDKNDNLIPELFTFSARFGKGNKTQLGNKTSINKYKLEIGKKFNLSSKFKLETSITKEQINSTEIVNNELLRFGGTNSINGFDDNSIFTNKYYLINTNLYYYLNNNVYIYTIFDVANYDNSILRIEQKIYSGGFGFSSITENGIISINYSKGNNWGNSFNLKNAKLNVTFLTFF